MHRRCFPPEAIGAPFFLTPQTCIRIGEEALKAFGVERTYTHKSVFPGFLHSFTFFVVAFLFFTFRHLGPSYRFISLFFFLETGLCLHIMTSLIPSSSSSMTSSKKVFVGGLSWETDESSLREYFSKYGTVSDCVIMRDRLTGHPRGFGFVTYEDILIAEHVASQSHELDGRQVEAKIAVPRSECNPTNRTNHVTRATKKVFVGGLPATCREAELLAYFKPFGDVAECQVMYDHQTGNSRGFGFVTFITEATVDRVVEIDAHEILGKRVEVKRAEPKQAIEARRGREAAKNSTNSVTTPTDLSKSTNPTYPLNGPWCSLFSNTNAWTKDGRLTSNNPNDGLGFYGAAQPYAPEIAQCVYNAFYGSESVPEGFALNVGGAGTARTERRFHPYPGRERLDRSYR